MKAQKLQTWISAARLRTLPLALSGVILASFIAYNQDIFRWNVCILSAITILLLQVLSNFANDYGDFSHGTDNSNRVGPKRALQSGKISPKTMKNAIFTTGAIAFFAGVFLLLEAFNYTFNIAFLFFLVTGLAAITAAIKYTVGEKNYGYKGLGDVMVFTFFGIAAVCGTHYLMSQEFYPIILLPATAIGLLSCGVLNVNNMRDFENDQASNKKTVIVRLGYKNGKKYHLFLITSPMFLLFAFALSQKNIWVSLSLMFPFSILAAHIFNTLKVKKPKNLDPELKKLSLTTLLISIWLGTALIL